VAGAGKVSESDEEKEKEEINDEKTRENGW